MILCVSMSTCIPKVGNIIPLKFYKKPLKALEE